MVNTAPTFASAHWKAISRGAASGFTSTAPRPSLAASAVRYAGEVGSRMAERRAAERAHEWCAALEQREAGGDELLCVEHGVVSRDADATAAGGERQREQGERIAHECVQPCVRDQISKRRSDSLSRSPTSARCWLDVATLAMRGGLLLHDGAHLLRGGRVRLGGRGEVLDLLGERLRLAALRVGRVDDAVDRGARRGDLAVDLRERVGGRADDRFAGG